MGLAIENYNNALKTKLCCLNEVLGFILVQSPLATALIVHSLGRTCENFTSTTFNCTSPLTKSKKKEEEREEEGRVGGVGMRDKEEKRWRRKE